MRNCHKWALGYFYSYLSGLPTCHAQNVGSSWKTRQFGKRCMNFSAILIFNNFNCSLFSSTSYPGDSQTWSGSGAPDSFTHAIQPLLWLTWTCSICALAGLPLCRSSNGIKGKTGPRLLLQDVMWTTELVGPEWDDLLQKCSRVFNQKFISNSSAFQKLNRFVLFEQIWTEFLRWTITIFGKWGYSCSVLL